MAVVASAALQIMCLEQERLPEGGKILLLREGDVVPVGPLSPDLSDPNDTGYKIETLAPSPRRFTAICSKIIMLNLPAFIPQM